MALLKVGVICACSGAALLLAGPLGTRAGLWPFVVGFALLGAGLLDGLAGASLSLMAGFKTGRWRDAMVGIALGLTVVAIPSAQVLAAAGAPPIHDITTDTADPPAFVQARPLRRNAANPSDYPGAAVAEQQRRAYPDIQPVTLSMPVAAAFDRALATARGLGWSLTGAAPVEGRIEAVDTTFWFGFEDDVVIRVRPVDGGSRIDVRSTSRVGVGDLGANARRIRRFLAGVRAGN